MLSAQGRQAALRIPSKTIARTVATSSEHPLYALGQKHVTKGVGRVATGVVTEAQGSYLHFSDGKKLLDFSCGIGVTNFGHCHPKIAQAAADQCMKANHIQCSIAFHEPYLELVEQLLPIMPDPSLDSLFFWNSGSEAVEAALKMARQFTGRQNFIVMQGGYHGRTFGAMSVTRSKTVYFEGVNPLMPGVYTIPFPHWHQQGLTNTATEEKVVAQSLLQLDLLLSQQTSPSDTAGILIEPVMGEGGYIPAPPSFLKGLRDVCDKHGMLLIIDEVQTGFGRTGKVFNIEYSGVRPDIMIMAKGLANGFPLSAVVTKKEWTDKLKPGSMGGTYAGNAVSCAAAVAAMKVLKEENILESVEARSTQLFKNLNDMASAPHLEPHILEVRGKGLMVAVEFASPSPVSPYDPNASKSTPKSMASRVAAKCVENGLMILTTSVYEVVRFIPPLNISEADMEKGCEIFREAVEEVVREG